MTASAAHPCAHRPLYRTPAAARRGTSFPPCLPVCFLLMRVSVTHLRLSLPRARMQDRAFHQYVVDEWGRIDGLRLQVTPPPTPHPVMPPLSSPRMDPYTTLVHRFCPIFSSTASTGRATTAVRASTAASPAPGTGAPSCTRSRTTTSSCSPGSRGLTATGRRIEVLVSL